MKKRQILLLFSEYSVIFALICNIYVFYYPYLKE